MISEFPSFQLCEIVLRALNNNDFDAYYNYVNDPDIKKQFLFNYDLESSKKRLEEIAARYDTDNKPLVWAITLLSDDKLIGIISIDKISFSNKNFSLACGIIPEQRSKGYAYIATKQIIDYMFNDLSMHRVELAHNEDNIASEKIFLKLGAKFEGIARESKFFDGVYKNRKVYSILKDEWDSK